MHLKQLKLSGFKSFVEPTVVPFTSQLIAVVGPNGCGKSNIIDAVRWVMGESSARNLRGESMADVIFNGSSTRKSVGQASVELIFDNSLGRLVGPYASYQEIAVKRLVTRDGDSFYFLNGSRCRRRDITDIFLGTGAGARGYSIIGQDTISRLIEAHPDDLRAYLEEAAGVSKYKERRRETLQRIDHTRANLARAADIADELGKQLQRLERQAQAAKRYKFLKEEERLCKAEILALKWRALTNEQMQMGARLSQLSLQEESYQAKISGVIKESSALQEKLHTIQAGFQQTQLKFYQLNTEIARLEEMIQQQQREQQRIITEKQQMEAELKTIAHQLHQDKEALHLCEQQLIVSQAQAQSLQAELQTCQQTLLQQEQQKIRWDKSWQQSQTALNRVKSDTEVMNVQLQHLQQQHQQLHVRLEKNLDDQTLIVVDPLVNELLALKAQQSHWAEQVQLDTDQYQQHVEQGQILRQQLNTIEQQLHQAHDSVQTLTVEKAALTATLNAKLRNEQQSTLFPQWNQRARLAEVLTLPEKWLRACELVLAEGLQAIVFDSLDEVLPVLTELHRGRALFVQPRKVTNNRLPSSYPLLCDLIDGVLPCWMNGLDQIFAAENLAQAIEWLPTLSQQQSVVTADGYWLGPGWIKVDSALDQEEPGLLLRQQTLAKLTNALVLAEKNLNTLQVSRDHMYALKIENEQEQNRLQQTMVVSQDELRTCASLINTKQQAHQQAMMRRTMLAQEHEELLCGVEDVATKITYTEGQWQISSLAVKQHEQELEQIMSEMACLNDALMTARRIRDEKSETRHQAELQYKSETLKVQQLRDNISREQRQMDSLNERLDTLTNLSNEVMTPGTGLKESLHEKVMLHQQLESQLSIERQLADDIEKQLKDIEQAGKQEEQRIKIVQQQLQEARLHEQGLAVRAHGILEALLELDIDAETILEGIPTTISTEMREQSLAVLDDKIKRLGAINLVAIEEYQTELERKQQLDEQCRDLTEALATLDAAIVKIDKETQLRLKETFDQVNLAFQSLFPRLFGGGRACLELTCDNLLESGILVMAQPPGKRNSTIHLLSGGEKAMTAVALVFAIFQLNPSPFCMLDEVDAPLDDLNIRRFCDLVKEMSQLVQFMFITHNKVTMEMADHLIGVTMREPGVSRLVTVDVDAAVKMQTNVE